MQIDREKKYLLERLSKSYVKSPPPIPHEQKKNINSGKKVIQMYDEK